ncbi:ribonuclease H-like domain-containing protein [Rhizophagus irregularis DAOM 181602=DAOM 197198]|nr:ribonuclease H-like domain-containing protein [Rhizophagus irregularis DAOM 181602=DAOM 197198]
MCNIPFSIIENPWFIDLIKTLQPGYDPPSRQVLSGTLLESETFHVNICIMNELSANNNFTITMDDKVKYIVRCANILSKYFKNSTLGSSWFNEAIKSKNIEDRGLKTYVKTRWTTVYECVHSVWRLKDALQHVLENHEHEISNQAIKTILKKRGFFDDVRVISDIFKLIKKAILMLERTYTTLGPRTIYI